MCRISKKKKKKKKKLIVNTKGLQRERARSTKIYQMYMWSSTEYHLLILQEVSTSCQFNAYANL